MNAQHEDYRRLRLRFARSLGELDPNQALREFAAFGRRFARERDALPQTDADRAFHLVALATDVIDYRLPFASDEQAEQLVNHARELLEEALQLDTHCYDASRMLDAGDEPSYDARHSWLAQGEAEVRAWCEAERDHALADEHPTRRGEAARLAMRPYLRWLYAMTETSLISGRNLMAIEEGTRLLDLDETDPCGVHHTLRLAYAKLEDVEGTARLDERLQETDAPFRGDDAWALLSKMAMARALGDEDAANLSLRRLVQAYPSSVELLLRQSEFLDGVFARVCVRPYSEEELLVALSEASVLLQEGAGPASRGALGAWITRRVALTWPDEAKNVMTSMTSQMLGGGQ